MPHVSKNKLSSKDRGRILRRFSKYFAKLNGDKSEHFLEEILTETEKVMLAKRLAIITMLIDGISNHMISQTLKVSPSTIARFERQLEKGFYSSIVTIFGNKTRKENFIKDLETFLLVFGPGGYVKNRHALINRMYKVKDRIKKYS